MFEQWCETESELTNILLHSRCEFGLVRSCSHCGLSNWVFDVLMLNVLRQSESGFPKSLTRFVHVLIR